MRHLLLIAALTTAAAVSGRDICVDYRSGKADNPGTREAPLATTGQALKLAAPGDIVRILPSDRPIRDNVEIVNLRGTREKPIVIDGMNNILLGTKPLDPRQWREVEPGLFRREVVTGENWAYRFFLTCNGKINRMGRLLKSAVPGAKFKKPDALAPGEWTVVKNEFVPSDNRHHKQFRFEYFVRLPAGASSLADSGLEEPDVRRDGGVNFSGRCEFVTVRNLIAKNFYNDGYNIHGKCRDLHFENIAAVDCCDDGISAHEACTLTGKNMVFIGCSTAICHIQNVTSVQENVYAEKITGRELYFLANTRNTVRNVFMIADSRSGSLWTNRKGDRQTAVLENIFAVSTNPESVFEVRADGELALTASDVQLAGFGQVMKRSGIAVVDPEDLRNRILAERRKFFAIFGGNLEKALE